MSDRDVTQDRAWHDYAERFRRDGLPKILDSSACLSIYSGDGSDFDVQQALELGAMLLLDKPLILVTTPGVTVPSRLARAADAVIENWDPSNHDAQERLTRALERFGRTGAG